MENYIFKRDYTNQRIDPENVTAEDLAPNPLVRGYLKFYGEFMSKVPKIIVQKDKETFERLLPKLNEFAKRFDGSIEACVDYKKWYSYINVVLPFFEIATDEDAEILKDIAENAQDFCVEPTDDNMVRVHVMIHYFEDIMPNDIDELVEIAKSIIPDDTEEDD